jgi:Bacterial Ig-like domain
MRRLTDNNSQGSFRGLPGRPIAALALLGALLVAGIALAAQRAPQPPTPPTPPAPVITSQPSDPSAVKSATFAYTDATSGVTFECQLDGGSYANCPGGSKTYSNLADEKHTFRVRAAAGTSKTSAGSTVSWTVDTTPPGAALVDPPNGALLGAAAWGHGCPRGAGLCGTAKDSSSGVKTISVSISDGAGHWWGGSAFNRSSETFQTAALSSQGARSVSWSYTLGLPADGQYTVHAIATDGAGNNSATQSSTFTVDTKAPPAPAIGSGPEATTTSKSASFTFSDQEPGAMFECSRDEAKFKRCTSPLTYPSNSIRAHQFQVRAKDGAGNISSPTTYKWTVVKQSKETSGKPFTVTGNAAGGLAPGVSQPLLVTIHNPNTVAITVTSLLAEVRAATSNPGCDGPANVAITQSDISATNTVSVPAGGQLTLPDGTAHAPQVLMKDLPTTNQDACKNATFTFNYSGSAHS